MEAEMNYPKYTTSVVVNNNSTDCFGFLHAKVLSQLVSDIANLHTQKLGVDRLTLNKDGLTWMLRSVHFQIDKMPQQADKLQITTYPAGLESLFALRCYEICNEQGERMVSISSQWMQIDISKRRPIRPTAAIVQLNAGLAIPSEIKPCTLNAKMLPTNFTEVREFVATFDFIDFNGHVTQSAYMMWITNSLTFDFHKKYQLIDAEVVYQHEILPENRVKSFVCIETHDAQVVVYHKLLSATDGTEHCIALTIWTLR